MTTLFSNSSPKISESAIFGPKFKHFYFSTKFAIRQIWEWWFQIWQQVFQVPVQEYTNKPFLVRSLRIFIFATNFATRQIWGRWFKTWLIFSNSSPKIREWGIFSPKFKNVYFAPNFAIRQVSGCWFQIWQ